MKNYYNRIVRDSYLGGEIIESSSKCRSSITKVLFGGAEKNGCYWKLNLILSFMCLSKEGFCMGSSSNMTVLAEVGEHIRFEHYLGVVKKETVENDGSYELLDRFFPINSIKLLEIETDHIKYEICFV